MRHGEGEAIFVYFCVKKDGGVKGNMCKVAGPSICFVASLTQCPSPRFTRMSTSGDDTPHSAASPVERPATDIYNFTQAGA